MQYGVVVNIESIKVEWNVGVGIRMHGKGLLPGMVERVITKSSISIWVIGYHNTIGGIHLRGEFGRPLSRL